MPDAALAARRDAAGPDELLRLKSEYLIPCVFHFYREPPEIVAGHGCTLVDHAGREYLDCFSGVTVVSAGHCNPEITEPAIEQLRTLQHTTSIYLTEPVLRLAEKLAAIAPGELRRSFFCASGSEAVEGSLLLAALHTSRPEIVAFNGGLHGRTRLAMNVTGLNMWRTDPFPLPGIHHARYGDLEDLRRIVDEREERIGAIIAEPIQGNAGINVPPPDFWPRVRELCDQRGIALIFDEVQTGFNRTGRRFACQHWGVTPDIMVVSKALGNGFPIAAFITTDSIAGAYRRPGASTYGGNPVCAAAALASIEFHENARLADKARERGEQLRAHLVDVARRYPDTFLPPRGMGLMLGLPVVDARGSPSPGRCDAMLEALKSRGMLVGKTGAERNVLTFMPPLVITPDEITRLGHAISDATSEIS